MGTDLVFSSDEGDATFEVASVGFHFEAGRYWIEAPPPGGCLAQRVDHFSLGIDGAANTQGGWRGRRVGPFRVCYVGASAQAVNDMFNTDKSYFENVVGGATVTVPNDRDYPSCYLPNDGNGARPATQPITNEGSTWSMEVDWEFFQTRKT